MNARVTFTPKPDKLADSILYLAHKGIELDQYKAVKLLYLADREHLRRFGRPITFDNYVAMKYGPVGSNAYDWLRSKKALGISPADLPFSVSKLGTFFYVVGPKREIEREIFSKSDLMVLDQTVEKYGQMSFKQLFELTHEHFAYDRAWKNKKTNADDMRFEDFLIEDASKDDRVSDLAFTSKGM